jgi:hypothetical protein
MKRKLRFKFANRRRVAWPRPRLKFDSLESSREGDVCNNVLIKSLRAFLLNLCLKLAGVFLSLARKLCGQSVMPPNREAFAQPAVALLLLAVISLLSSQSKSSANLDHTKFEIQETMYK